MKLQATDFFFYPNGEYQTKGRQLDRNTNSFFTDLEEVSRGIRIFGTETEIDKALDDYIKISGLNLDESYSYQVEKKGTYWYKIFKNPEEHNQKVKEKFKIYTDMYQKQNKPLIIRIS